MFWDIYMVIFIHIKVRSAMWGSNKKKLISGQYVYSGFIFTFNIPCSMA